MSSEVENIVAAVRANCDISDAAHARDMTLCSYLLAMRDYFCWERGLVPGREPERAEVGAWIAERERRWDGLEGAEFAPIPLAAGPVEPFAVAEVNDELLPQGWVYGASVGRFGKPHFFLGRLVDRSLRQGIDVIDVGAEAARDLEAAPASLESDRIVLRREAFERWLWTSAQSWDRSQEGGAMHAALEAYGFVRDRERAIAAMVSEQRETLLLHELGEHAAGCLLGEPWEAYLRSLTDRRAVLAARAVRDLLADCLVTLPAIARQRRAASLHFWFATFGGLRRQLYPTLLEAYAAFRDRGTWTPLEQAVDEGRERWALEARALAGGAQPQ